MEQPVLCPNTIAALRWGADAAFAMLAGMQLDLFTALQSGPRTPPQLADTLGVGAGRLRLLLYALETLARFSDTLVFHTPRLDSHYDTSSDNASSATRPRLQLSSTDFGPTRRRPW